MVAAGSAGGIGGPPRARACPRAGPVKLRAQAVEAPANGKKAEAVVQQKKAIELAPSAAKAELEATLRKYEGK